MYIQKGTISMNNKIKVASSNLRSYHFQQRVSFISLCCSGGHNPFGDLPQLQ